MTSRYFLKNWGHLFLPASEKWLKQFSIACSAFMLTSITHIFRRLCISRKKLFSILASSILFYSHGVSFT
ncbi:hypothetical protein AAC387_Pa04g1355 [Persea americana]